MKKVHVGIEIKLLNGNKAYVYISKSLVIQDKFQFKQDYKADKCLNEKIKRKKEEFISSFLSYA